MTEFHHLILLLFQRKMCVCTNFLKKIIKLAIIMSKAFCSLCFSTYNNYFGKQKYFPTKFSTKLFSDL